GGDSCVVEHARVVVKHLHKDIAPEPAQPLAILEHGDRAVGSLVNRLKPPHLHSRSSDDRHVISEDTAPSGASPALQSCVRSLLRPQPQPTASWMKSRVNNLCCYRVPGAPHFHKPVRPPASYGVLCSNSAWLAGLWQI